MKNFIQSLFGQKTIKKLRQEVEEINKLESALLNLSDEALKEKSLKLKEKLLNNDDRNELRREAFALVREASRRTLGQRHFDVQLMAGLVLDEGKIAEMFTGEGKTLAATAPAYFNALEGRGVHIVTVNDYLARRDAIWMGQIYYFLGMKVGCLVHDKAFLYDPEFVGPELDKKRDELGGFLVLEEFLRPVSRTEAYLADVTYGTNQEFGFDYLRDNLVLRMAEKVQRPFHYAIIDEVDNILIDEARTPLIIASPDIQSSQYYKIFSRLVQHLENKVDYEVDEKTHSVAITESGIEKIEKLLGLKNIYSPENSHLVHFLQESLKAKELFRRDKDYVVKNNEVIIVDEFTGRLLYGRRYAGGLHQAIEAKENVLIKEENRTLAQITIQNYFRLYEKIAGMTGTAQTSAEEFHKVYNLEVVTIPTNKPMIRNDLPDLIYKTEKAKYEAIIKDVKKRHEKGQPILIGTTAITKNEIISDLLKKEKIPHEVLNAKNNEREGAIIAQAGKLKAVTVATNMAGRGVDIILGGNPPDPQERQKVCDLGGLHVIGTERHEARRIDNQLRGRAGRQGDPGSSQFFLSLEDDLMRIFGGEKIQKLMEIFQVPEDVPLTASAVAKAVNQAQQKVEGANFDIRRHLLDFDDVLNRQRKAIYHKRDSILEAQEKNELKLIMEEVVQKHLRVLMTNFGQGLKPNEWPFEDLKRFFKEIKLLNQVEEKEFDEVVNQVKKSDDIEAREKLENFVRQLTQKRLNKEITPVQSLMISQQMLRTIDFLWIEHLENLESLRESVNLRAYGQKEPLVEYRQESRRLFDYLNRNFEALSFNMIFQLLGADEATLIRNISSSAVVSAPPKKIGRNDPCWCGAKKPDGTPIKYKKCHGK